MWEIILILFFKKCVPGTARFLYLLEEGVPLLGRLDGEQPGCKIRCETVTGENKCGDLAFFCSAPEYNCT